MRAGIPFCFLLCLLLPELPASALRHHLGDRWQPAICFSAYRDGQSPSTRIYPSEEQIREDLYRILPYTRLLRLYDCSPHAERTLKVIEQEQLPFRVLLGAWLAAEYANPANAWMDWSTVDFEANKTENAAEIERLISLANRYPEIIEAVAVGNEILVDWTSQPVSAEAVLRYVRTVKAGVSQPVSVCDNWVPWKDGHAELAAALDFISLHTYPQWEYKSLQQAMDYTRMNYFAVRAAHPGKPVIITEAGWCTTSNSPQMITDLANPLNQADYIRQLLDWCASEGITCFIFEAFDENWKGSDHPQEPEKHWGIFTANRQPKPAAQAWLNWLQQLPADKLE